MLSALYCIIIAEFYTLYGYMICVKYSHFSQLFQCICILKLQSGHLMYIEPLDLYGLLSPAAWTCMDTSL